MVTWQTVVGGTKGLSKASYNGSVGVLGVGDDVRGDCISDIYIYIYIP